jgi:hypothetical protein
MKKLLTILLILGGIIPSVTFSQPSRKTNLGIGGGLDYGGLGGQLSYLPIERIALFGAAGYNLNTVGYNFGVKVNFPAEKRVELHITGMYGYNAVLIVKGNTTNKTTYYGPSIGAGLNLKSRKTVGSFWSFELLLPFRVKEFHDAIDSLKQLGYDVNEPLPVGFSVGYHFLIF